MEKPTLRDVLEAQRTIAPYVRPTPLHSYPVLDKLLGTQVYVKHENYQPIGAFKMRGGVNFMAHLPDADRKRGVITASTGNHGQSIAYAGHIFGTKVIIVVPEGANPGKVEAIQNWGAEVVFHGKTFDDAREYVERTVAEKGYSYVHPANDPSIIAGVGTMALEVLEAQPDIDVILAPVGGGSSAAGCCIVAKAINPAIQIIGVQAEKAPAAYLSWREQRLVEAAMETTAEGLATGAGFELTQSILREHLYGFVLVSDEELRQAVRFYLEEIRTMVEAAGAALLAGAIKIKDRLRDKKVALILSGGNISVAHLREALTDWH
jgi:threonine dehydratase